MENLNTLQQPNIVIAAPVIDDAIERLVAETREASAHAVRATYGAHKDYARALNTKWSEFDWFNVAHNDNSEHGKAVRAEKLAYFDLLKGDKHSNPSTIWARIRKYADELRYGVELVEVDGEQVEAEMADEGESGASHNRSPLLRNIEELVKLYKFNRRQESLEKKVNDAQSHIIGALVALGVDVGSIAD